MSTRRFVTLKSGASNRWVQLSLGVIAMVAISNLQYGWTLFVNPIADKFHWNLAAIQVAFTFYILAQTWLFPLWAYLADCFGPRLIVAGGGVLVGLAWVINAAANSLLALYLGGIIGGIGAGSVYGATVGNALKWFTDRRGLAAGLTAAAYGAGSALTIIPIAHTIKNSGYQSAFLGFGLLQGLVILSVSLALRTPENRAEDDGTRIRYVEQSSTPQQVLQAPPFWLLYVMFVMICSGGLMAVAQLGPLAKDFGVATMPVSFAGLTLAALPLALSLEGIMNGLTRPFFGWVSDYIGRENTMFVAFSLEGMAKLLMLRFAHNPVLFVLFSGLMFFAWGEIYSLFPAISCDLFGRRYATTNYGLLYTAKGVSALFIPIGSLVTAATGGWQTILVVTCLLDLGAAVLALFVLKPLRKKRVSSIAQLSLAQTNQIE